MAESSMQIVATAATVVGVFLGGAAPCRENDENDR